MRTTLIPLFFNLRTLGLLLGYWVILFVSYWVAFELRFDFAVTDYYRVVRLDTLWWVLTLKLALLFAFGQFETVLAYFRLPDAIRLFLALLVAAIVFVFSWYQLGGEAITPRSVILSDLQLSFLALASFRLFFRLKASKSLSDWLTLQGVERVLVIGAGEVGAGLASELLSKGRLGMRPVAFLDDDPKKVGRFVHGVPVAGDVDDLPRVAKECSAKKVIIAFPSAAIKRVKAVASIAQDAGLIVETVPALTDLVSGKATVSQVRPVNLEDLLGRESVDLNDSAIESLIAEKRILITGAGGSIGSELVEQVLQRGPAEVLCLDQSELAIFDLRQKLFSGKNQHTNVSTKVFNICDSLSLSHLMEAFKPQVVFHAAAHKHVNLMEDQPEEAIKNNTLGSLSLARIASRVKVEHFIFISTDKAINPTNVMGASKRLAELCLVDQQKVAGNTTRFISVRFGNVLGSSGSVIPIFRQQLSKGGPITVTDPEVTRFFMTVEEAVGLVLQSASQGEGGEIFVLDMGKPVKILDIARQMIGLAGMREGEDIEIEIIGLRPGEKRFEELQHLSETLHPTTHPRILRFVGSNGASSFTKDMEQRLKAQLPVGSASGLKQLINEMLPEYQPHFGE